MKPKGISMRVRLKAQDRLLEIIDKAVEQAKAEGDTLAEAMEVQAVRIGKFFGE